MSYTKAWAGAPLSVTEEITGYALDQARGSLIAADRWILRIGGDVGSRKNNVQRLREKITKATRRMGAVVVLGKAEAPAFLELQEHLRHVGKFYRALPESKAFPWEQLRRE